MRTFTSQRNVKNNSIITAAASAAATLSIFATAPSANAQTWNNPNTGNWSVGPNWVGGAGPVSSNTTVLQFNAVGVQSYTASNNVASPFHLDETNFNNTGSGVITIAGSPLEYHSDIVNSGSGAVVISNPLTLPGASNTDTLNVIGAGSGTVSLTGALSSNPAATGITGAAVLMNNPGVLNLSGGGNLYALRAVRGTMNVTGGAWTLNSTQRQNDTVNNINDGFWALNIAETTGQTARFTQSGGSTITAPFGFIGVANGSTGIATFTGAGTSFTAGNATPQGVFGVNSGAATISVLDGAVVSARRLEFNRQANSSSFVLIDGPGSRMITTAATPSNIVFAHNTSTSGILTVQNGGVANSGAGFFTATTSTGVATINVNNGTLSGTGVAVVSGGGGTLNPQAGKTTINVTNGGKMAFGTLTYGQEPGDVTVNVDGATAAATAVNRIVVGGQNTGTAAITLTNGAGMTAGSFINIGGGFVDAVGDPIFGGSGTVSVTGGSSVTAGSNMTLGSSINGQGRVTVSGGGSQLNTGTGNLSVGSATNTFGSATLSDGAAVSIGASMFAGARPDAQGNILIDNVNATYNAFMVIGGGGGSLNGGSGTVTVRNGATLNGNNVNVGQDSLGVGTLEVTGPGTSMQLFTAAGTSSLVMGLEATAAGTFNLSNGASANISGGSTDLVVGSDGNGTMNITGSSLTHGGNYFVGAGSTSTGYAAITNGTLSIVNQSQIGGSGDEDGGVSTMTIQNGAATAGDLTNVYTPGTLIIGTPGAPRGAPVLGRYTTGGDMVVNGNVLYNAGTLTATGTLEVGGTIRLSSAERDLSGTPSNKKTLEVGQATLTSSGVIDLDDNDMLIHDNTAGARQKYENFIATARNGGAWNQPGITSSAAKNAAADNTTLGVIDGSDYISVHGTTFNGRTVSSGDKVIKYTYYGDADFNGSVDFDDYVRTDAGFNGGLSGWFNGDFDLNGSIDFDDYVLIDLGFNTQNGTLSRVTDLFELAGPDANREIVAAITSGELAGVSAFGAFDELNPAEKMAIEHAAEFGDAYVDSFLRGAATLNSAVPEPATIGLVTLAAIGSMTRRRRSR